MSLLTHFEPYLRIPRRCRTLLLAASTACARGTNPPAPLCLIDREAVVVYKTIARVTRWSIDPLPLPVNLDRAGDEGNITTEVVDRFSASPSWPIKLQIDCPLRTCMQWIFDLNVKVEKTSTTRNPTDLLLDSREGESKSVARALGSGALR